MEKPFSQAAENNKAPILEVLKEHIREPGRLLEVGSGTGQHAVWLAPRLPGIHWQPSDRADALPGIRAWLDDSDANNVAPPLVLDVNGRWPDGPFDYIFTANTFHIMAMPAIERCLAQAGALLRPGGLLLVYGPFRYQGDYTSASNRDFDHWLHQRHPDSGIRDFEWLCERAGEARLTLVRDHAMPANNRLLVFARH